MSCTYLCSNRLPFLTLNNDLYKFLSTNNDWKAFGVHKKCQQSSSSSSSSSTSSTDNWWFDTKWQYLIENRLELFRFWKLTHSPPLFKSIFFYQLIFCPFFEWANEPKLSILQSQHKCPLIIHKNHCASSFFSCHVLMCHFFFCWRDSK